MEPDWAAWLDNFDHLPPETRLSWGQVVPGDTFRGGITTIAQLRAVPAPPQDRDYWVGLIALDNTATGRGKAADAQLILGVWADLDYKPGALGSPAAAGAVIADLAMMLDNDPSYIVHSGHGQQPVWLLDPATAGPIREQIRQLKRWGLLVARASTAHGAPDSVFDAARILRAPGTINHKNPGSPVPVGFQPGTGEAIGWGQLADTLDGYNIPDPDGPQEPAAPTDGMWTPGAPCPAVTKALGEGVAALTRERHPTILKYQTSLARLGEQGHQGTAAALEVLRQAFTAAAQQPGPRQRTPAQAGTEWAAALAGIRLGAPTPPELRRCCQSDPAPVWEPPAADDGLWEERPWLGHIRDFARHRMVSPYALLAVALTRVCVHARPGVTIQPIIGGKGSLNMFTALVGGSGGGKSATTSASDDLMPWADEWKHTGSGEGLLHSFVERKQVRDTPDGPLKWAVVQHTTAVVAVVDEVDALVALGARQGATLLPILRSAWSASSIGFGYADPTKKLHLKPHSYRLGLVVGAQPDRCGPLFDAADSGTPQRFLWAPVTDPGAPGADSLPPDPGPLPEPFARSGRSISIPVAAAVRDELRAARTEALRGGDAGLDGHAGYVRLKIAAACALMEGRFEITETDWGLAARIIAVSDSTREKIGRTLADRYEATIEARARTHARSALAADQTREQMLIGRVLKRIGDLVVRSEDGRFTVRQLQASMSPQQREVVFEALDLAREKGIVRPIRWVHPGNGQTIDGYGACT